MALSKRDQQMIGEMEWQLDFYDLVNNVDRAVCDPRLLIAARYMLNDELLADTQHYNLLTAQVGEEYLLTPDQLAAAIGYVEDQLIHQDQNV